jgi:Chaperone of endosialidase
MSNNFSGQQLINVAAATKSNQAVNKGQLNASTGAAEIGTASGGDLSAYDSDSSGNWLHPGGEILVGVTTKETSGGATYINFQNHGGGGFVAGGSAQFQYSDDSSCTVSALFKSRGTTVGSHGTVQLNDDLGEFNTNGWDGTQYTKSFYITAHVSDTVSDGVVPTQVNIATMHSDGSLPINDFQLDRGRLRMGDGSSFVYGAKLYVNAHLDGANGIVGYAGDNGKAAFISSVNATNVNLFSFYYQSGGPQAAPTSVGNITTDGTNTTYGTSSDYRLKGDIKPLENSGSFIDRLKPSCWVWKSNGEQGAGLIAHEAQEVSPSSVSGKKDAVNEKGEDVYQTVGYASGEIIANLIAEIQSLRKRVLQLESKNGEQ